jgi:hypothetical protein
MSQFIAPIQAKALACPLRFLPHSRIFPQNVQSVQRILDCLVFFGRATVVHGEFMQPRPNAILRCLDLRVYSQPVGFEQCGSVEFLPTVFGLDIHVTPHSPNAHFVKLLRKAIGRSNQNNRTLLVLTLVLALASL